MNCINFNNKIYFVKRNHNENNNSFIERMWYIINQQNLKKIKINHLMILLTCQIFI